MDESPRFIPIKCIGGYLLKSTLLWMRRGELGRSIETRLNATIQFNDTLQLQLLAERRFQRCALGAQQRRCDELSLCPAGSRLCGYRARLRAHAGVHETALEARLPFPKAVGRGAAVKKLLRQSACFIFAVRRAYFSAMCFYCCCCARYRAISVAPGAARLRLDERRRCGGRRVRRFAAAASRCLSWGLHQSQLLFDPVFNVVSPEFRAKVFT